MNTIGIQRDPTMLWLVVVRICSEPANVLLTAVGSDWRLQATTYAAFNAKLATERYYKKQQ